MSSIDPQLQKMIDNMPEKTGRSLDQWFGLISESGLKKHGEIMKVLKAEHAVSHGYANTITLLFRKKDEDPVSDDHLVDQQYAGPKAHLRDIYDCLVNMVGQFGSDVTLAPKKAYVSLRRNKQFAIIKPSTKTRVDLGLNLKGEDAVGRLEGGKVFSGMCSHLIKLSSIEEVDDELKTWLRHAYDQS